MTIRLYDSLTQQLVPFVPIVPGEISLYVCGPTVQSAPHIGHLRSALVYDLWRNWFEYNGYRVTLIRNITDIDDKVLANAKASEQSDKPERWWELAYRVEAEFESAYQRLGIRRPSYGPRATGSITAMQKLIDLLIAKKHAYVAADHSGDVYFDTASWPEYGQLTRQQLKEMVAAEDSDSRAKKDIRDFALWKGAKPEEPVDASWESPWGRGRPGWHIECSAMATQYLGSEFDIHGGGLDLRFPHHENELAQSKAAGHNFARYWLHNGLVQITGQKMSKSLGNSVYATELFESARPIVIRYFLLAAHYRSVLEYHPNSLAEATAAFERIESFITRALKQTQSISTDLAQVDLPPDFIAAMSDDLATPQALAVLHETVRAGNTALDTENHMEAQLAVSRVIEMASILGINPLQSIWSENSSRADQPLNTLVSFLIMERNEAKLAKDYELADQIRAKLEKAGISISDGPNGTVAWGLNER